ncbi:MAG: Coq4 family protein [Candidatus Andeanibacterium colombiense]|uniref:Coq4 family protein n=1 Tax=Candidatus Andeanibacterium colombiense TaxID=3121345 RepID=A0AAJ5X3K6_9SPHN|nr:MAG: Coq4 family protein [Sphingomonadaceae bacterium]
MDMLSFSREIATAPAFETHARSTLELPVMDPRRDRTRYRPLKAWRHFRELVKDKENTGEVFHIFESLPWKGMPAAANAFLAGERGQRIIASEPSLPAILDDHAALRRMPEGSVAHAYCDFMESEELTAQGLVDEFEGFLADRPRYEDQFGLYLHRIRDTHDLLHVLTGYGRDALGEQCVLAFTYSQQPSPAHLLIAYAGAWEIRKEAPKSPIFAAVREGQRLGKACPRLAELAVREILPLPLAEVRAKLNITPARHYQDVHRIWRAHGVDPYDILGQQAAA